MFTTEKFSLGGGCSWAELGLETFRHKQSVRTFITTFIYSILCPSVPDFQEAILIIESHNHILIQYFDLGTCTLLVPKSRIYGPGSI